MREERNSARAAEEKGERIEGMTRTYEGRQLKGEAGPGSADRSPKQMQSGRTVVRPRRRGGPTIRRSDDSRSRAFSSLAAPCSRNRLKLSNVPWRGVHFEEPLRTETNQLFVLVAVPPPAARRPQPLPLSLLSPSSVLLSPGRTG